MEAKLQGQESMNNNPLFAGWFSMTVAQDVEEKTTFGQLLDHLVEDIKALAIDGEFIFKQVGCFVINPKGMQTPACSVRPLRDPDEVNGISNIATFTDYRFGIGIGVKGSNDEKIIDDVFRCRSAIKTFFSNKRGYDDVVGHVNTTIENKDISYDGEAPEGALLFGSGIEIICKVQE